MATAATRRQALADLARARKGDTSAAVWVRRIAVAVVIAGLLALATLWLLGFFSAPKELKAVQALVDQQMAELQKVARNEAPFGTGGESFGAMFEAMRQVPEPYREQAREQVGRLFEARETAEVNSFFAMRPEQRMAELDRRIQAEEERRKAWEARRRASEERRSERSDQNGSRGSGTGGGGSVQTARTSGGSSWGNRSEESRVQRSKDRIDKTTAESRARRTEYRRAKDQRRIQLGLSPGR